MYQVLKVGKTPNPLKQKRKDLVPDFSQISCVRPFDHKDFKFQVFSKKKCQNFIFFFLMLKDPQVILAAIFSEKMSEAALLCLGKY